MLLLLSFMLCFCLRFFSFLLVFHIVYKNSLICIVIIIPTNAILSHCSFVSFPLWLVCVWGCWYVCVCVCKYFVALTFDVSSIRPTYIHIYAQNGNHCHATATTYGTALIATSTGYFPVPAGRQGLNLASYTRRLRWRPPQHLPQYMLVMTFVFSPTVDCPRFLAVYVWFRWPSSPDSLGIHCVFGVSAHPRNCKILFNIYNTHLILIYSI